MTIYDINTPAKYPSDYSISHDIPPDFKFIILADAGKNSEELLIAGYQSDSPGRLKSVGSVHTMLEAHELAYKAFKILDDKLFFAPDFPEFLVPKMFPNYKEGPGVPQAVDKAVTWGIVRQEPGTVSGAAFTGTQEISPRKREGIVLFSKEAQKYIRTSNKSYFDAGDNVIGSLNIYGQVFDNLVQYNIWAKSNYEVEKLTQWFKETMRDYTGMFREAGIVNMHFDRRLRDDTLIQMQTAYHVRSVLYYFRTEEISFELFPVIKRIDLNVYSAKFQDFKFSNLEDKDLYERILKKWLIK